MKLSIGPVLYYWRREVIESFYDAMRSAPVDIIYLGETVCSKRHELRTQDWIALAQSLTQCGKEIVLSTLTLLESNADFHSVRRLCDNDLVRIEANDMAAVNLLAERKIPFCCGPAVNIYNQHTLRLLARQGMQRWVMPVELGRSALADILAECRDLDIETEVFAWGKLPLAWSARCFTARALNLPKDDCRYSCLNYPEGMELKTQESQELFTINGIQTLSGSTCNLLGEWQTMRDMGVDILRISPQFAGTETIIRQFADAVSRDEKPLMLIDETQCNGYWYGEPGMIAVQ